jgi:hypothetical protein
LLSGSAELTRDGLDRSLVCRFFVAYTVMSAPTRRTTDAPGLDHQHRVGAALMLQFPHITFTVVAGPFDWPLMIVVLGTMTIAILGNVLAAIGWIRRRR